MQKWGWAREEFHFKKSECVNVTEQKEVIHPALAEPNTKLHRELQGRKIGYFLMDGAPQENGKLMLKGPNYTHPGFTVGF